MRQPIVKEIPNPILLGMVKEALAQGHTATIRVKGRSMRPFIEGGRDEVRLAPATELRDYDAALAEVEPDHYVLHRVVAIEGDCVTLMGDGNIRGTESCSRTQVVGVVTHYIRPGRVIPATSPWLRVGVRVWRRLLPLRRYLLYIYRKTMI